MAEISGMNKVITDRYALYLGDCCDVIKDLPDRSVGLSLFSPPFAELYCYSDDDRDMGNSASYAQFFEHFAFLVRELKRVVQSGRLVAVHCIDIPAMKERDGYIGLKDFPGDLIRSFQNAGFIYHSRHVIWKDPLIEATRTKALGLMHKQLMKDSAMCRSGLPDYLLAFRVPGENANPISHPDGLTDYSGSAALINDGVRSHNIWRAYASPVWMDIRQTHTLNKASAREESDQKHICPLQLDVIDRAVILWSNPGDVVFTPFMGIGSEVYGAVRRGRRAVGAELKRSYFQQSMKNARIAASPQASGHQDLFADEADVEAAA